MTAEGHTDRTVSVTIDGRRVELAAGSFVLAGARKLGIDVPTLCDHPDLEPVGSCRLCMVEVTHPDWKGWKGLVTACLYPVEEGLQVSTGSEAVLRARRGVLSLLAARCPGSDAIRALAERHGASIEGLRPSEDADDCILCGSCTRVCDAFATSAITTTGRGTSKLIGSFASKPPADCVGCGGCAMVCPTGAIEGKRDREGYHIWDRTFAPSVCVVDSERCIGCGSCAEACPFSVARVALGRDGAGRAVIPEEHCRGCGACVGACPTGAITQRGFELERMGPISGAADGHAASTRESPSRARSEDGGATRAVVYACGRSSLGARLPSEHADSPRLVELPCTGRVSVPLLLAELAAGAPGVLVLGRHERTCRLGGAETIAARHVERTRELLGVLGLEPERISFVEPASGPAGPPDAVSRFLAQLESLGPLPSKQAGASRPSTASAASRHGSRPRPSGERREDLDSSLELLRLLAARTSESAVDEALGGWLRANRLPACRGGDAGVLVGELPWLDLLTGDLLPNRRAIGLARAAVDVLRELGNPGAGIAIGGAAPAGALRLGLESDRGPAGDAARGSSQPGAAMAFDAWLGQHAHSLPRPASPVRMACDGSTAAMELVRALGHEPIDVGPDPLPDRFFFSSSERAAALERLLRAHAAGASLVLLSDPRSWIRTALLVRPGSWRLVPVAPVLGVELVRSALWGRVPSRRSFETSGPAVARPSAARAGGMEVSA